MTEAAPLPPQSDRHDEADQLETLRDVLLAGHRRELSELKLRLDRLENRITDPQLRATDASEVLVPAMLDRLAQGDQLGNALKPVVVEQFHHTSRNDPEKMADALFPILGPAIRKMIAAMLIPDSKAKKRTYRLEQLFLIDKESGLPICNVSSDIAFARDAAMVSGMLSAIQSFVHEAFSANDFDGLNTLQVGQLSVWIEWGPSAILAAVIRGTGPEKLREAMQIQLESIHHKYTDQLAIYEGDTESFDFMKPELSSFIDSHDGTFQNKIKRLPPIARQWLKGSAIALLGMIGWVIYQSYDNYRWSSYVASLEAQPGIIVTNSERHFRNYIVRGLRDPLSKNPVDLLAKTSINAIHVTQHFEPYQALHPAFVLDRARTLLKPSSTVTMTLDGTTLNIAGGETPFTSEATKYAPFIVGIDSVAILD